MLKVVLISIVLVRLILSIVNYSTEGEVKLTLLIKDKPKDCRYLTETFELVLDDCFSLEKGGRVEVIGVHEQQHLLVSGVKQEERPNVSTLLGRTDSGFSSRKRLKVRSYAKYTYVLNSPKDWLLYFEEKVLQFTLKIKTYIDQNISYSVAWLVSNSILGYASFIPKEYAKALGVLGLQHLIAVSGFHISFLLSLLQLLPIKAAKKYTLSGTIFFICTYWLAVGLQPAVNRAVLMSLAALILKNVFFLQVNSLKLLLYSACIWVFIKPLSLFSVSFQLSYLATTGIITFFSSSHSENVAASLDVGLGITDLHNLTIWRVLKENMAVSFVAQLYTFPAIWFYFGEYPTLSLVANVLLFWLAPVLIVLGCMTCGLSLLGMLSMAVLSLDLFKPVIDLLVSLPGGLIVAMLASSSAFSETILKLPQLSQYGYLSYLLLLAGITYARLQKNERARRVLFYESRL